jgi:tRNA A37 threonylcarbamoyladenosine dehydratase
MKKSGLKPQKKFRCVYSPELSGERGTLAPVVGTFGMTLASLVIRDILE